MGVRSDPSYGWQASQISGIVHIRSSKMHYVYLLRSESHPKEQYLGCTTDLKQRLVDHNRGDSPHTSKFAPWRILAYFAFAERQTATAFEKYLKSGSARAFAKRHFR